MVITPDIPVLPYQLINGIKHFRLIAEPVERQLISGIRIRGWGYNGTIPGPTIQVYPGDWVNIQVVNHLPDATSVHWHGLDIPNVMDGVPAVEPSPLIKPGQSFHYRFQIVNPPGTHMYHAHFHTIKQEMLGLGGGFIILDPQDSPHLRDYFLLVSEFSLKGLSKGELKEGSYVVDPMSDRFNFFTINGRSFPDTTPIYVKWGDHVRLRFGNLGVNAHPMHLHGHQFTLVESDGNPIPACGRFRKNTILVASGETWAVEFQAHNPGVWPLHCHVPHHIANNFTLPVGGMFTTVRYEAQQQS